LAFCVEEVSALVVVVASAAAAAPAAPPVAPSTVDARRPDQAPQWGQWHSRRRRRDGGGGKDDEAAAAAATAAVEEEAASERAEEEEEEEAEEAAAEPKERQEHCLSGVAQLALLPSGDMTGHFVAVVPAPRSREAREGAASDEPADGGAPTAAASVAYAAAFAPPTPVCLAATARLVLAESSCMRDEEWSLLRLTLSAYRGDERGEAGEDDEEEDDGGGDGDGDKDGLWGDGGGGAGENAGHSPSSSASSVSFWVQRTGGDLCRITPADVEDEQTADAIAADQEGEARRRGAMRARARPPQPPERPRRPPPRFSFRGESLYADAAAEAVLAQISPALAAAAASAGGGGGGGGKHLVINAGPAQAEGLPAAVVRRVGAMAARAAAARAAGAGAAGES